MIKRIRLLSALLLLSLSLASFSFSEEKSTSKQPGVLEDIVISKTQNVLEVKILFSPYTYDRRFRLSSPNRIVVDLFEIHDIKSKRHFNVDDFDIKAIRAGMFTSDIGRVVFDLKGQFPLYKIIRIPEGLKVSFWKKEIKQIKKDAPEIKEIMEEEPRLKHEAEKELQPSGVRSREIGDRLQEIKEATDKINEKLEKTIKRLDKAENILNQMQEKRATKTKKFVRISGLGNYFQPRYDLLKDVYKNGVMYGAELNVGVWNFVELWLAQKNFSKKVTDEVTGEDRKVNLVPIEAGLKFRFNKGKINPYLGVGAGYYQYKETTSLGEIKEKEIGFVGQAGCFIKIGGYLVFDVYANYSYCRITTETTRFNVGGLHLGVGFGFEY
jgi:hypothetical protein